jgi:hypothetical protein
MHANRSIYARILVSLALMCCAVAAPAQSTPATGAKPPDRIRAFSIDFNWAPGGRLNDFAPPGTFAHADPEVHYRWYKDLGANVIHTFCVTCDGYAWYRQSAVAPVEPGLKHDFLNEITALAHRDGVRVMGYFCVGANTLWAQKHPDQSYGSPSRIHIPLTNDYLDYLTAEIKDVLVKTEIDGFQLDWMYSPPLLMKEKNVRWMPCEQEMYRQLFGRPFPGKDKIDAKEAAEFQRRALDRCWRRIHEAARAARPSCIIWLSCYDLKSPQVVGSRMFREVDWLVNEHFDPRQIEAIRKDLRPRTKIIQCLCGWVEHDPRRALRDLEAADVGLYGFARADPATTLPPAAKDAKAGSPAAINARNIEILRELFHAKPTQ